METPDTGNHDEDGADGGGADPAGKDDTAEAKLARQVREKDAFIAKLQSERDKARNEAERTKSADEKLAAAMERLAEATGGARAKDGSDADASARVNALIEDVAAAMREDEVKGTRKLVELMSGYAADVERKSSGELAKAKQELLDAFGAKEAELREMIAERDPEYVSAKDRVAQLAEELGIDPKRERSLLLKLVKREMKTSHPGREELPGGVGERGRSVGAERGNAVALSEQDYADIEAMSGVKLTDSEKRTLAGKK
ncbi:MAG: hypothetical protein ACOYOU_14385 [Kiritimatiellia bacterium]